MPTTRGEIGGRDHPSYSRVGLRPHISHTWFPLVGVGVEVQPFAGWISVIKADVDVARVALLVGKRAENGYVFQQCENDLGDLDARSFNEGVDPGGASDFAYSGIFQNVKKGETGEQPNKT